MTLNLYGFPAKAGEDIYRTKAIVRRAGKGKPRCMLLIPKLCVDEQKIEAGQYFTVKMKRITDAYCEVQGIEIIQKKKPMENYPLEAELPIVTQIGDGQALYIQLTPIKYDIKSWFEEKDAKGFDVAEKSKKEES